MKLSDYRRIADLVATREYLLTLKDVGRIEVSINGAYQNRVFVDHVEPAIRLELRYRIHELEQELIELGVDVGG